MLSPIELVLLCWIVCAAGSYVSCRDTYRWSMKKSFLISCLAWYVVFIATIRREASKPSQKDEKINPKQTSPRRINYQEKVL